MLGNIAFACNAEDMMSSELNGQRALVTGAGRGIGRGCAEALAEAGAEVIAVAALGIRSREGRGTRIRPHRGMGCRCYRCVIVISNRSTGRPQHFGQQRGRKPAPAVCGCRYRFARLCHRPERTSCIPGSAGRSSVDARIADQGEHCAHVVADGARGIAQSHRLLHDQARHRGPDQSNGCRTGT